eukprot:1027314-Amphidinium_carterae.1
MELGVQLRQQPAKMAAPVAMMAWSGPSAMEMRLLRLPPQRGNQIPLFPWIRCYIAPDEGNNMS